MAEYYLSYSNVTVDSNSRGISQFLVQDRDSERGYTVNMTEENSASFDWLNTYVEKPTVQSRFQALINWFASIFNLIVEFFKNGFSL